jgi:hypothetical protein
MTTTAQAVSTSTRVPATPATTALDIPRPTPNHHKRLRIWRPLAAVAVALGVTTAGAALTASPASATTTSYLYSVGCVHNSINPWTYMYPNAVTANLPQAPIGTVFQMSLYRWYVVNNQWVYGKVTGYVTWAQQAGGGMWYLKGLPYTQTGGVNALAVNTAIGQLKLDTPSDRAVYFTWVDIWLPNGNYLGGYSQNNCDFR